MKTSRSDRISLCWILILWVFLSPCLPVENASAQSERRRVFDVDRSAPSKPRPAADTEVARNLRESLGRDFGPTSLRTNLVYVAFFLVLFVIVAGLIYYDMKYRQRLQKAHDDPDMLFRELCIAHELTKAEKRFLRDFAGENGLKNPLSLFIEPKYFEQALERDDFASAQSTIEYLLEKLFDLTPEDVKRRKNEFEETVLYR